MSVETAMRQPGVLHHLGHPHTLVATQAQGTRGGIDDALVREFLAGG